MPGPARATVQEEHSRPPQRIGLVLAVVMVGTFLAPLDASIVNVALPAISKELAVPLTMVQWVATGYLITTATLTITMGRLGDVWGLRKVYVLGFAVFGLGSLACAFSPTFWILVAARVFQAVGASMIFAVGPALVAVTVPPQRRGWALGLVSLAVALGLTLGPPLGGLLTGLFGWPAIFLVNVPLSIAVGVLAWFALPTDEPIPADFDLLGAALAGAMLLSMLFGLTTAEQLATSWPLVVAAAAATVGFGALFARHERRARDPMVDMDLLLSGPFGVPAAAALLAYVPLAAVVFLMPFYFTGVRGLSEQATGLSLMITPVAMAALSPVFGRLSDSWGSRGLATSGMLVVAAGTTWLSFVQESTAMWFILGGLFLAGLGIAMFQTPNTSAILGATPRDRMGVGSAIVGEARSIGQAVGIAMAATVLGLAAAPLGAGTVLQGSEATAFVGAMAWALRVSTVVAIAGAALSWRRTG